MYRYAFAIISLACSFSFCKSLETITEVPKNDLYYAGCKILNADFKIVRVLSNDYLCLPLSDGGWISSNHETYLKKFNVNGEQIWSRDGYFHHQLYLDSNSDLIVMNLVRKKISNKYILYDEIYKINVNTGAIKNQFKLFNELQNKKFKSLDLAPQKNNSYLKIFNTDLEKMHLNSISTFAGEYIFNDIDMVSFKLNSNLKLTQILTHPGQIMNQASRTSHDLQQLTQESYLIFKNFYPAAEEKSKTFKIYEFTSSKITFEFPIHKKDYVRSDYSGGVQKNQNTYLVGFPINAGDSLEQKSFVGLVSNKGHWIKKAYLDFRIQDIKRVPYPDYIKLNQVK